MSPEDFKKIAADIPVLPGVYKFIDEEDVVLYVGKARRLKNRIASYFTSTSRHPAKTRIMLRKAVRVEYILVDTEADALLLENSLIKKYQPRYNHMLKDGKSYSYICIKHERFPRVFITRNVIRDGSVYFGPYTSKTRIKTILELLRQLFPLRTCTYNLSEKNIEAGKFKLCLEYHIKNCKGPCTGLEEEEEYNRRIEQIKNILRGHFAQVKKHFREQMMAFAERLEFEKAQEIKEKLRAFENYQARSTVVSPTIKDVDVFAICSDETYAYVNYLKVVHGAIIHTWSQELVKNLDQDEADLLAFAILEIRDRFNSIAPEILTEQKIPLPQKDFKLVNPKIGDKRKLLELSQKNARFFMLQQQKSRASQQRRKTSSERILRTLQKDLHLKELPLHIECFDNSNIQGAQPVAACVVFKNARPSKKDYRHFNIKTVEGPNDFASMEEVVFRRYRGLIERSEPLPQLILIDGGKGQLSAAVKALKKLDILDRVQVAGIAKRLEEIYLPGDSIPLYLDKKSESLKLIQQLRNEAHRFAISFHRDQRSRQFTRMSLTEIPGIGEKTAQKLLKHFGSLKRLRSASPEELLAVAGKALAKKLENWFEEE
ncbi:MAG TPA: excinuclease ABC subunit C [Phaeodactylibacter sp.]|nr:excinuclease ABC subunit C [Phaeodactylibacter sp.]